MKGNKATQSRLRSAATIGAFMSERFSAILTRNPTITLTPIPAKILLFSPWASITSDLIRVNPT